MIKNYLTVAIRNIARNKTFSVINILGLAIGMACCILILLYVQDELSYDQHHEHADRIYRIATEADVAGTRTQAAITPFPMGPALVKNYPEVIDTVRFYKGDDPQISVEDQYGHLFFEDNVLFTDANVFEVFNFSLSQGDIETAFLEPFSIVITEAVAQKYFGKQNPLGQTLTLFKKASFKVTGVLKDTAYNTHLQFDFLASPILRETDWMNHEYYTYLLLGQNDSAWELEGKLPNFIEIHAGEQHKAAGITFKYFLQPLTDIHLHSYLEFEIGPNGDIRYFYSFFIIAFFVLVLACINFVSLSMARSATRSKEVGIRKVVGANRVQLIHQFMDESILLAVLALLFALVLVEVSLPAFNAFIQRELVLDYTRSWQVTLALLGIVLFAGLVSGIYPALFLSAFQPVEVLTSTLRRGLKISRSRKTLVVFQFVISIILIIGTVVVYHQADYIRNKKLGFDKEHVIVMPNPGKQLTERYRSILSTYRNVLNTSRSVSVPGRQFPSNLFRPSSDSAYPDGLMMNHLQVDHEFISTYGLELIEGRDFSKDIAGDKYGAFILNEAALRKFGWSSDGNRKLEWVYPEGGKLKVEAQGDVVGVVKDFHYKSLHHEIEPLIIMTGDWFEYFAIRIRSDDIAGTLSFLKAQWKEIAPNKPFDYFFLDDDYDKLYRAEKQIGTLFGLFSILAILVASLGLFGLASFTAQRRIKEIGIRKVLGASVSNLVLMLSKEFALLVGTANLIAWPIAYYAMNRWLQDFAYRIDLGIWPFIWSGLLTLLIASTIVSYQAWKVARTNPVDALRYE